jgi:ferric enterobactin receptor
MFHYSTKQQMFEKRKFAGIIVGLSGFICSLAVQAQQKMPSTQEVYAQVVQASDATLLAGATVILLNKEGGMLNSMITSEDGKISFTVPTNTDFRITISYVGFKNYSTEWLTLTTKDLDLGDILLEEDSEMLKGITVIGYSKKPLVESKKDGITYNAGSDISNKVGTAADVLRKAPMLTVEANGEVKMRGSSNIKVLLNGVPSGLMAKNLKEALKMIPASSIESVEVITNPSSKYEAEGAAGVINIITKKKLKGTSGVVDLAAGNLEQSGNLALNMATGKFNFSAIGNFSAALQRTSTQTNRISLQEGQQTGIYEQDKRDTQRNKGGFLNFTTQYQIDSTQSIEGTVSLWRGAWPQKSTLHNYFSNSSFTDKYTQYSDQKGIFNFADFVLNYQKKFKRTGHELQLIGQRSMSGDVSEYITNQYKPDGTHVFRENSPNKGRDRDWSIQTDYAHPLSSSGKSVLETGLRYFSSSSLSEYSVVNSVFPVDPSRSGSMQYEQNIFSSYASVSIQPDKSWTLRPGVRYERTGLAAQFKDGLSPFNSKFHNVLPSVLISKVFNEKHQVKINYTERIRRPWIWDLSPYTDASDPLNIRKGNPELRPELTKMFELGHVYNSPNGTSLISSVYFNTNRNAIESITSVDNAGVSHTTSQNIGFNRRIGANINVAANPTEKWTLNAGGEVFYLKFRSKALDMFNDGTFFQASLNNSYEIRGNYTLLVSGNYGNGYITLQGKRSANYLYQIAARKQFLNNKANVTLAATNVFQKGFVQRVSTFAPSFDSNSTSMFYNRSVSLTFSWQFGKMDTYEGKRNRFSEQQGNEKGGGQRSGRM